MQGRVRLKRWVASSFSSVGHVSTLDGCSEWVLSADWTLVSLLKVLKLIWVRNGPISPHPSVAPHLSGIVDKGRGNVLHGPCSLRFLPLFFVPFTAQKGGLCQVEMERQ